MTNLTSKFKPLLLLSFMATLLFFVFGFRTKNSSSTKNEYTAYDNRVFSIEAPGKVVGTLGTDSYDLSGKPIGLALYYNLFLEDDFKPNMPVFEDYAEYGRYYYVAVLKNVVTGVVCDRALLAPVFCAEKPVLAPHEFVIGHGAINCYDPGGNNPKPSVFLASIKSATSDVSDIQNCKLLEIRDVSGDVDAWGDWAERMNDAPVVASYELTIRKD